jgi:hypothetical protein
MPNRGKNRVYAKMASPLSALLVANLRRQETPELFRQFPRDDFSADRPNGAVMPEKCVFGFLVSHLRLQQRGVLVHGVVHRGKRMPEAIMELN